MRCALDMSQHVRMQSGHAYISIVGSGVKTSNMHGNTNNNNNNSNNIDDNSSINTNTTNINTNKYLSASFSTRIHKLYFTSKPAHFSLPTCSPATSARFPDIAIKITSEINKIRTFMNVKCIFHIPSIFHIICDTEAMNIYQRMFGLLMRVKFVGYVLERLWMLRSKMRNDRNFCHLRQIMQFFINNLLYYLQVIKLLYIHVVIDVN